MKLPAARPMHSLVLGASLLSTAPIFVRVIEAAPAATALWRMAIGTLFLAGLLVVRGRARTSWPGRRATLALALAGAFFALDLALWHKSIHLIGPGLATLLANLQVFSVAGLGAVAFRERVRAPVLVGAALALGGLALLVGPERGVSGADAWLGVGLGLIAAVSYSLYLITLRIGRERDATAGVTQGLLIVTASAAITSWLCALAMGEPLGAPTRADVGLLVAYGVVVQVVAWLWITSAVDRVSADKVGVVLLLQPALAFVWDVLFFDRAFGARGAVGSVLVLVGLLLATRARAPSS